MPADHLRLRHLVLREIPIREDGEQISGFVDIVSERAFRWKPGQRSELISLPDGIAALCRRELELSSIIVEAAATGDRNLALQALLLDPMIGDLDTARAILNDFLTEFAEFLPQFA